MGIKRPISEFLTRILLKPTRKKMSLPQQSETAKRIAGLLFLVLFPLLSHAQQADSELTREPRQSMHPIVTIVQEQPNGLAERTYFHYEDPDVTMRSYAAVTLEDPNGSYCSGTMIGPNVMMTAGHCGQGNTNAVFRIYTADNTQVTESFACQYLLHTFADTDLTLYWCSANAAGENPGDKYGYGDFDVVIDPGTGLFDYNASRALLTLNTTVYSIWMNPINNVGPGWYSIYSEGRINKVNYGSWFTPNVNASPDFRCGNYLCVGGLNPGAMCGVCNPGCIGGTCGPNLYPTQQLGVASDLWAMGGASGSSQLRQSSHRILVGPLSVSANDARYRSSMGIADYLAWAITDVNLTCLTCCLSCVTDQINQAYLTTLGLPNPGSYFGGVDGNLDGLFDVQHDLELIRGEHARDWYWLGFESHRRNTLWAIHAPAVVTFDTTDPATGTVTLSTLNQPGSGYLPALSREGLNLQANQFYRISFMMNLSQTQASHPIRVCLEGTETHCVDSNPSVGSWLTHVSHLWASPGARLRFYLRGGSELNLVAVSLISAAAQMNFDTHDKRYMWRNHNTGGRGRVWPNGVNSATNPDWAGAVYRNSSRPLNDDWSLRDRQLAIDGGATYRVCFQHRNSSRDPLTGNIQGTVRLLNEFGLVAGSTLLFAPGTNWQQTCTGWFYVPTDDNNLQFGVQAGNLSASGTYLIDNIQIERQAPASVYVDWRNQAFREEGTLSYPFNRVGEGAGTVGQGGELYIASGSYHEKLTVHTPMTLRATGGSVVIGQ